MHNHNTNTLAPPQNEEESREFHVADSFQFTKPDSRINPRWFSNVGDPVTDYDLERVAYYSVPLVNHVKELQPHVVIGCDRGGRLTALAVRKMWKELMPDKPFPTLDGKVNFAKLSTKHAHNDYVYENMRRRVAEIIGQTVERGEKRGNELQPDEQLRVLFIDDWTFGGGIPKLVERLSEDLGLEKHLAVMEDHWWLDDWIVSGNPEPLTVTKFEATGALSDESNVGVKYDGDYNPHAYRGGTGLFPDSSPFPNNVPDMRKKLGRMVNRVAQYVRKG